MNIVAWFPQDMEKCKDSMSWCVRGDFIRSLPWEDFRIGRWTVWECEVIASGFFLQRPHVTDTGRATAKRIEPETPSKRGHSS